MEADSTDVDKTISLFLLFFHGISVPSQVILQPLVDAISMYDAEVSQSIIGEIENLEFSVMCSHEVVCHDGDEALAVLAHTFEDVLLCYFIELVCLIEYEVDRFHFLIALLTR